MLLTLKLAKGARKLIAEIAEDYWLQKQVAKAQSAMISFYHALLVAYHDAASETPSKISITRNPVTSLVQEINRSSNQAHPEATSSPSEYPSGLKCPHGLSKKQERLNFATSDHGINVDSNAPSRFQYQCSICDGVARRGILQDSIHLLPLSYVVDSALSSSTSTTPVIIA